MAVTQYVGSRYVPIFADPEQWTNAKTYEPLTIVLYQGNSFTSKQFVPVGIDINNTNFWAETGNYNAQVEQYRRDVQFYISKSNTFSYATMQEAIEDVDNIRESMFVQTNGYYAVNDGGNGLYYITNAAVVPASIEIGTNKFATLISDGAINVQQIGASHESNLTPYIEKVAGSIELYYRCFIPAGDWYLSPLLLNSDIFFELYGVEAFHTSGSNCTILHPLAVGQDYIIKLGGSAAYDEDSIDWSSACKHIYLHDIVFYSNTRNSDRVVFDDGAALALSLCLYSRFDNINFTASYGTCLSLCDSWECLFDDVIIRSCGGPQYKIIARANKHLNGISASPNVSACDFNLIHAESIDGGIIQIETDCGFANNHIGTVIYEGGTFHADSTEAWTPEDAETATPQYLFDLSGTNCVIESVVASYFYCRSNIRTYGDARVYFDAMFHTNIISDSATFRGMCRYVINTVTVAHNSAPFVLYRSNNFLYNDGFACSFVFNTVILENNQTSNELLIVDDGCIPVISNFITRNAQHVFLGADINKLAGYNIVHRGSIVTIDGVQYAARRIPSSNSIGGIYSVKTSDTLKLVTYNFNTEESKNLQVRIYTDESNYTTKTVACEPGLSVHDVDISESPTNMHIIFLNPSYQVGICDVKW